MPVHSHTQDYGRPASFSSIFFFYKAPCTKASTTDVVTMWGKVSECWCLSTATHHYQPSGPSFKTIRQSSTVALSSHYVLYINSQIWTQDLIGQFNFFFFFLTKLHAQWPIMSQSKWISMSVHSHTQTMGDQHLFHLSYPAQNLVEIESQKSVYLQWWEYCVSQDQYVFSYVSLGCRVG